MSHVRVAGGEEGEEVKKNGSENAKVGYLFNGESYTIRIPKNKSRKRLKDEK